MSNSSSTELPRRGVLRVAAGAVGAAGVSGVVGGSQHDIDVSFSDESGAVGEQVSVSFDIAPANSSNAQVSGYDVEVNYDPGIVSFVEMDGVDLAQPAVSDDGSGTITANAGQTSGESTPLTAATITFQIDQGAQGGDSASIDINAGYENEFLDDPDPVPDPLGFESQAGSVTVSTADTDYQLSNLDPESATVFTGSPPINITVDVTNNGTDAGVQELALSVTDDQTGDGVYTDTVGNIALDPGDSRTVSFEDVPAGSFSVGGYTHTVDSFDDTVAGSLVVEEQPDLLEFQVGDANMDGEISLVDSILISQELAMMDPEPFSPELADIDRSGEVDLLDLVLLSQFLAGARTGPYVEVDEITVTDTAVTAQLQNTGGLGALSETELWIVAVGTEAESLLTGYRAEDPPRPSQLSTQIRTAVHDIAPDGGQGTVEFDIGGLSSGSYRGLVYTGEEAETFTFQKS